MTKTETTEETAKWLKKLAPLEIGDCFEDFPNASEKVYIFSRNTDRGWIIAKDIYRPLAILIVDAFNEKYEVKS